MVEIKQTPVEWVIEQLLNTSYLTQKPDTTVNGLKVLKILNQAKEMENNQHKEMFDCGRQFQLTGEGTFKQVHEELYGK